MTDTSKASNGFVSVGLEYHKTIDYDRRAMKKALLQGAAAVRKEARRKLARRAVSAPGEYPGRDSGKLQKSIGVVSKGSGGGWIRIAPRTFSKAGLGSGFFYPGVLGHGSQKRNIKPRADYMVDALQAKRDQIKSVIQEALRNALVPR